MKKLNEDFENDKISDNFYIHVKEHFHKMERLSVYLTNNKDCAIKVLLFQILHTLHVIQEKYPSFRHNSFIPENIFIYKKKSSNNSVSYNLDSINFNIPDEDFEIKISDFYKSSIEGLLYNDDVEKDQQVPHGNKKNKYYDIFTFINDLINYIDIDTCSDETKEFIKSIIPDDFSDGIKKNEAYTTPKELLMNQYFSEYRTEKDSQENSENYNG